MLNAANTALLLNVFLSLYTLLFLFRIILTWYPEANLNKFPFAIAAWPTEVFLIPVRKVVPPIGGVDISPIIWVGIVSFFKGDFSRAAGRVENAGLVSISICLFVSISIYRSTPVSAGVPRARRINDSVRTIKNSVSPMVQAYSKLRSLL